MSAAEGFLVVAPVVRTGALVERHDDVGPELLLKGNRLLGGEAAHRAVQVGAEGDPLVIHLASGSQREDLEAARVGEDRPGPS